VNPIALFARVVIIESNHKERKMKFASLLLLSVAFPCFADTVHWEFSESTNGNDVLWISPTSVDPNADQYEYVYDITYIAVDVEFLGQIFGPFDVTGDIDPEIRHGKGTGSGPAPILLMDEDVEADADGDGDIDVGANIFMQLNANGYGQLDITNVFLGDVLIDMGWPFGNVEVDIDRIYLDGAIDLTSISNPCPADINGDSVVDVTDILTTIGNWGGSGEGDVDGSGIVDVSDLLAIVGAWGPC
tara:strand:- start:249 stop:983 length:735 start_codon:yes stop_codon:yes gene_type:complete